MNEVWENIPGYPSYQASSAGRIRRRAGTPRCLSDRILAPKTRQARPGFLPYRDVALSEGGVVKTETVHKLVCLAFHGDRPSAAHEVAHKDGDPANNEATNIRWATVSENKSDYVLHGKTSRTQSARLRAENGRFR